MAFLKYANAAVVKPVVSMPAWDDIRSRAVQMGTAFDQRIAANVVLKDYDPNRFLLSHCFPAGHKVLMADGTEKPIEAIQIGDEVITHKGNIRPVTQLLRREVDEELIVLQSASLPEVSCTSEHPFYVIREQASWCKVYPSYLGEVKCTFGGKQVCEKNTCVTNGAVPDWVNAGDIRPGDRTYTPTLHETRVPSDLNANRLRLLGYYVAEGHVDKDCNHGLPYMVRFSIHEDEIPTLGVEISRLMRLEFGISTHSVIKDKKRETKGVTLSFHSFEHAPWFLKHAGCGSRSKRLSLDVMLSPVSWQRPFVGSWINGDGSSDGRGIRLVTSSEHLASQAVVLFDRLGIHSVAHRVLPTKKPRKSGPYARIRPFDGWHVCIPKSYARLLSKVVLSGIHENTSKQLSTKGRYRYAASTISTVEGVSRRHFAGTVYNLSVGEDESYIVNRQAVHNCTIIASVDTEVGSGQLGKSFEEGITINRRFADYLITPQTSQYVNNNQDSWERKLLLATFKTFVGGENYVEHLQIPEMSKGKIIDAAARDIGDSIYVDILVATDRKHQPLINAIASEQLTTLSMGCFLPGTQVSMGDGTRVAIEDVQVGDYVVTHKGRLREVTNKQMRLGNWGVQRIQAVGVPNTITATDNHPFFVLRPATKCACGCGADLQARRHIDPGRRLGTRFKVGHDKRILNPNGTYSLEEHRERTAKMAEAKALRIEEVRADQLQPGDYVCFPKVQSLGASEGATAGKAKLLGYFLAEGSFLKYKGEPVEVQFNFAMGERDSFVAEVVQLLKEEFPAANEPWVQERTDRNTATIHMTGREAVKWFKTHGGEYSHRKRLSFEVMNWPTELHLPLLGAWLNGDGTDSVGAGTALSGTSTSYDLICQLHCLAMSSGVFARLECLYGGHSVDIQEVVNAGFVQHPVTGKRPSFNLVFGKHFASRLSVHTDRSLGKASRSQNLRELDDVMIFPITSVVPARYEGWVHDMEVEEDHSYVVEGVAVHNCQVSFTICSKCGNVAEDETQLCTHIRYSKGNTFVDTLGKTRKIAELCVHPSTRVVLADGSRIPVGDVQMGDMVLSHTGQRREVTKTHVRSFQGSLVSFRVEGVPQPIRVTEKHPFWVLTPSMTCACGCGQCLPRPKNFAKSVFWRRYLRGHNPKVQSLEAPEFTFKDAGELQPGDTLALPIPTMVVHPRGDVSEAKAEMLGWFLAEGSFLKHRGQRRGVAFTLNADDEYPVAERLAKLLEECFPPEHTLRNETKRRDNSRLKSSGLDDVLAFLADGPKLASEILAAVPTFKSTSLLSRLQRLGLITSRALVEGEYPEIFGRKRSRIKIWSSVEGAVSRRKAWYEATSDRDYTERLSKRVRATPHIYRYPRTEGGYKLVVHYNSMPAAQWFYSHAGEYAATKKLSQETLYWPLNLQSAMLKGYVRGDGQADFMARHSVSSISETLISQMQLIAARCGFWTRRQVIFDHSSAELMQVVGGDSLQVGSDGFRPRHEMYFQPADETTQFFGFDVFHERRIGPRFRNYLGYMLYPIREVHREPYSGLVHNLSVEVDESYLVEGLATHNCGHVTDPKSVRFIEASWVANPAFTGAVLRNILSPGEIANLSTKMQVAFSSPTRVADPGMLQKAARQLLSQDDFPPPTEGEEPAAQLQESPMDAVINEMADYIREKAIQKARGEINKEETLGPPGSENENESLIKSALAENSGFRVAVQAVHRTVKDPVITRRILSGLACHQLGGWRAVQARGFSGKEILAISRFVDLLNGGSRMAGDNRIYRTVLAVGGASAYGDVESYLLACRRVIGRDLIQAEKEALIIKGKLFDLGQ